MLWANPDPNLAAPKEIHDLFPQYQHLCLEVKTGQRVGSYGFPGRVILGVPSDSTNPKKGYNGALVCNYYVAGFQFGYMPYCCGVGIVYQLGGVNMTPVAWEKLFSLVLPKNPHMLYLPASSEITPTFEGVGKVIATTRNKVHDSIIVHRMWTPSDFGNYFFETDYPPYRHPTIGADL